MSSTPAISRCPSSRSNTNRHGQGANFNLAFEPAYGQAVLVAPGVQRITVNNPSAFTFHGTNSYIVGGIGRWRSSTPARRTRRISRR